MKRLSIKLLSLLLSLLLLGNSDLFLASELPTDASSLETVHEIADRVARNAPSSRDGISKIDHEAINAFIKQQQETGISTASASARVVDSMERLEIASALSLYDGLSQKETETMYANAGLAKITAVFNANEDPYRHFMWNFISTKELDATTVAIYTCNYEWANILYNIYKDYYYERYNAYYLEYSLYISWGFMDTYIIDLYATADADDYIVSYRNSLRTSYVQSYGEFCKNFQKDNIMDFWNNYCGRLYAQSFPNHSTSVAFNLASNNGYIIFLPDDVETSLYKNVYYNDLWRYSL